MDIYRAHVLVCGGTGCSSSGSATLIELFEQKIEEYGLSKEVKVIRTGCFGLCEAGPVVIVYPEGTFYSRVKPENVEEIVTEHLLKGRKVEHLVYTDHATKEQNSEKALEDINFYKHQHRIALRCESPAGETDFSTEQIRAVMEGVSLAEPAVVQWIQESLQEEIEPILGGIMS